MSEVTFTPEQIKEIRRRIEAVPFAGRHHAEPDIYRADVLAAFPLPKVTRYRTFERRNESGGLIDTYRVKNGVVEFYSSDGQWKRAGDGDSLEAFAHWLVRAKAFATLAIFADICARPTEEVPDDGR